MFGWMGKYLRVNLSDGKIKEVPIDEQWAKTWIGGSGFGARLLYDEVPPDIDEFDEKNKLYFFTGPLSGGLPCSSRFTVVFKSPISHGYGEANSGGFFAFEMKRAGYDGIVIEGKSEKPVYLSVKDNKYELRDASKIWGKGTFQTQEMIQEEIGEKKARVLCIGPAGEKKSKLACIINDEARALGRGGSGAVMGSKNFKAIAIRGTGEIQWANPEAVKEQIKKYSHWIEINPMVALGLGKYGTEYFMDSMKPLGDIPIKNWQLGEWEGTDKIGGGAMYKTILKKQTACYNCPIRCGRWIEIKEGPYKYEGPGPEYETCGTFGALLLIDNLEPISWINYLCNDYGVDTISTGATVAWAIEAYEKGIIKKQDIDGIELAWGDPDAVVKLTEKIVRREGKAGELLADGSQAAADKLGKGHDFLTTVKGLEAPMHDPRAFYSMGVEYATAPRGACHVTGYPSIADMGLLQPPAGITKRTGRFDPTGKGTLTATMQDVFAVLGAGVICMFGGTAMSTPTFLDAFKYCCGWNIDELTLKITADRLFNLKWAYCVRAGMTAEDNKLPKRLLQPTKEGGQKGKVPPMDDMMKDYYAFRGWTENAIPTKDRLIIIGLPDVAKDLWGE
ncbi:MAG: aldehyde ferredoxin oxidoreductase family protein [Candidatus Jordarchaeum sp.]|uniref:aldehyde ferredoxin oxidoreductase family protein n=1 Tax=Candidatus Jordarchaeum sp. TaxID=2823881 RepID=UPI00404AB276